MARPRKDAGIPPARERIDWEFWQMMEELPYAEITVGALCRRANTTRNSFYYHFECMDDLVEAALEEVFSSGLLPRIMAASGDAAKLSSLADEPVVRDILDKLCLLAGPHSDPRIAQRLNACALKVWTDSLGVSLDKLDEADATTLAFFMGGSLAVLGNSRKQDSSQLLRHIHEGEAGEAMHKLVSRLSHGNA